MFNTKMFGGAILLSLLFLVSIHGQDSLNQHSSWQNTYDEYKIIWQRLKNIQDLALQAPKIIQKTTEYNAHIDQIILRNDPYVSEILNRRNAVSEEYINAAVMHDNEKMTKLQNEFNSVSEALKKYRDKAMEEQSLKLETEKYKQALYEKMQEINPDVPNLLSKMQTLLVQLKNYRNNLNF